MYLNKELRNKFIIIHNMIVVNEHKQALLN